MLVKQRGDCVSEDESKLEEEEEEEDVCEGTRQSISPQLPGVDDVTSCSIDRFS